MSRHSIRWNLNICLLAKFRLKWWDGWVPQSILLRNPYFWVVGLLQPGFTLLALYDPALQLFLDSFFCDFQEHRSLDLFCQRSTKLVAATIFTFWICGVFPGLHLGPGFGFLAFNKSSCCFYPSNFNFTVFLRFTYWCLNLSLLALYNWLLVNQLLGALH